MEAGIGPKGTILLAYRHGRAPEKKVNSSIQTINVERENQIGELAALKKDELLAYETGIHLGDGSLQIDQKHRIYRVIYCGDSRNDADFFTYVLPVVTERLYGKKPSIYYRKNENTIVAHLNSKEVVVLKTKLLLPVGNKIKLNAMPGWLTENLVPHFLRGLADTDFCISFKRNRKGIPCEPRIEFFTNNEVLATFSVSVLRKMGFTVAFEKTTNKGFREYRLRMYGKEMLNKWMKHIGFFNMKHLSKVLVFEKFGYCQPHMFTQERLRLL